MLLRFAFALLAGGSTIWAQLVSIEPRIDRSRQPDAPNFVVESPTVVIPVHASTTYGGAVVDLKREDFKLYDDGLHQTIRTFSFTDAPVSVGIVFDASGSMSRRMTKAREAVAKFMQMANKDDEFFLVVFRDRPKLALPFTDDPEDIQRQVAGVRPSGCTGLYDAVALALRQMNDARHARKALVVFSDGGDNRSRQSFNSIKNQLFESDVQLYAIGIYPSEDEEERQSPEDVRGPELLAHLADGTGGRHFAVTKLDELPAISERVSLELRNQYVLGYIPNRIEKDGRFHKVSVRVDSDTQLFLQYRRGYYAPSH